ncbi:MAG: hypothetical protein ACLGH7_09785, partial [Actinomycetes bacterium]
CEACNHTKETPGWTAKPVPGPRHTVATTTPTGHTYNSTAPPLPGTYVRAINGALPVARVTSGVPRQRPATNTVAGGVGNAIATRSADGWRYTV